MIREKGGITFYTDEVDDKGQNKAEPFIFGVLFIVVFLGSILLALHFNLTLQ